MYWREEQRRPLSSNSSGQLTGQAHEDEHIYCVPGQEIALAIF